MAVYTADLSPLQQRKMSEMQRLGSVGKRPLSSSLQSQQKTLTAGETEDNLETL